MMRIAVRGIGVAGAFGSGVGELVRALDQGRATVGSISLRPAGGHVELPAFRADTARLGEYLDKRKLRRIDHFAKLGLLGAYLALDDAGMLAGDRERMGVVIASGHGATGTTASFVDTIINAGDICASPTCFANSLHNAAAANIAMLLGATGPNLTVSQYQMSVPSALLTARQWLLDGRVDTVLFGALDEVSELLAYIWYRLRGEGMGLTPSPLQTAVESAVIGEGAAFLLLTRDACGVGGYGTIDGVTMGRLTGEGLAIEEDALLVLAADGRRELGGRYRDEVPKQNRISCYTPLYGSMPAAFAFDIAVAALMLREGRTFPSPVGESGDFTGRLAGKGELPPSHIACLTLGADREFGMVTLGRP